MCYFCSTVNYISTMKTSVAHIFTTFTAIIKRKGGSVDFTVKNESFVQKPGKCKF